LRINDKESDRPKLKACPWCLGHTKFSLIKHGHSYTSFQVKCEKCAAHGPYEFTEREARERWNRGCHV